MCPFTTSAPHSLFLCLPPSPTSRTALPRFGLRWPVFVCGARAYSLCSYPNTPYQPEIIRQGSVGKLQWPGGVARPEFKTRESGVTKCGNSNRKRGATRFELWPASSRRIARFSSNRVMTLSRAPTTFFGLVFKCTFGRGATASKTETLYFPPPR